MTHRVSHLAGAAAPAPAPADDGATVTIPDVELCSLGTWAASTGRTVISAEDFASMMAAASDPEINAAPIKIGHVDPRYDGEPALGWVENLRVNGTKLVGDLVDVPAKMASVIRAAFRRRSVEIAWGVTTPSGKRYKAALSGLALLGVTPPAVSGLADVLARYAEDPRSTVRTEAIVEGISALSLEDTGAPDAAAVAGFLSTTGASAEQVTAALSALGLTLDTRPSPTPAPTVTQNGGRDDEPTPPGGLRMKVDKKRLEELMKLEGDALDAEFAKIVAEAGTDPAKPAEGDPAKPAETADPAKPAEGDNGGADPAKPAATAPAAPALATLSAAQWAEVQSSLAAGAEARRILREQEIAAEVTSALAAGKIHPTEVEAYTDFYRDNFDKTKVLVSKLAGGKFSTTELGSAAAHNLDDAAATGAFDSFEAGLFGNDASWAAAQAARAGKAQA